MKIAIICAMQEELDSIMLALGGLSQDISSSRFDIKNIQYCGHDIAFILSGIGKVNAALHTQYIIDTFNPQYVINVGVAGGLSEHLNFGDVVIADDLVQHDMDITAFGLPIGQIARMDTFSFKCDSKLVAIASDITHQDFKVVTGRIATGDQFIDSKTKAKLLLNTFGAIACEMEGAAVAHVCYVNKLSFLVVRSLSDRAGNDNKSAIHSFEELKDMVAMRSSLVVRQLLERL